MVYKLDFNMKRNKNHSKKIHAFITILSLFLERNHTILVEFNLQSVNIHDSAWIYQICFFCMCTDETFDLQSHEVNE